MACFVQCDTVGEVAAKFIICNPKFIVLNTKPLELNTKSIDLIHN